MATQPWLLRWLFQFSVTINYYFFMNLNTPFSSQGCYWILQDKIMKFEAKCQLIRLKIHRELGWRRDYKGKIRERVNGVKESNKWGVKWIGWQLAYCCFSIGYWHGITVIPNIFSKNTEQNHEESKQKHKLKPKKKKRPNLKDPEKT